MRRFTKILRATILLLGGMAGYAHACSCVGPAPVCSIEMGKSTIFRGTVVERTLVPNIQTMKGQDGKDIQVVGGGTFEVRLAVAETFSGEAKAEQVVYTAQQSSMCGFPFQVGREYVVFTFENKAQLWTSLCSRTTMLEPGVENAAVTWMRAYKTAPPGSEIFGALRLPRDSTLKGLPASIQLKGPESRTLSVDEVGKYSFRNLQAGEYSMAVHVPVGFASSAPRKITVADKGCAEVDWPVTFEGRIEGRVVDVDGRPVADLRLELHSAVGALKAPDKMTTTDLNGEYKFEHLSPNDYFVAARSPEYMTEEGAGTIYYPHAHGEDARAISVGASATVGHIDFVLARLRPTPSVRVNVVLPDGSAAPAGLRLFAFPNGSHGDEPSRTGVTDATGLAVLPLTFGREYAISVALDAEHPKCGFVRMSFSDEKQAATLAITNPEACGR